MKLNFLEKKYGKWGYTRQLQDDINTFIKWSNTWQMLFNFEKGHGNTGLNYYMGGAILCKSVNERYLGVTIYVDMKVSEQCRIAASQVSHIIGMIRRNIT